MDVVQTIFGIITQAITSFTSALTSAVGGVTGLFYVEASGTDPAHMTFLGVLLLIAAGVAIVYWCVRLIKGLIQRA